jgi:hypothetical protein
LGEEETLKTRGDEGYVEVGGGGVKEYEQVTVLYKSRCYTALPE